MKLGEPKGSRARAGRVGAEAGAAVCPKLVPTHRLTLAQNVITRRRRWSLTKGIEIVVCVQTPGESKCVRWSIVMMVMPQQLSGSGHRERKRRCQSKNGVAARTPWFPANFIAERASTELAVMGREDLQAHPLPPGGQLIRPVHLQTADRCPYDRRLSPALASQGEIFPVPRAA